MRYAQTYEASPYAASGCLCFRALAYRLAQGFTVGVQVRVIFLSVVSIDIAVTNQHVVQVQRINNG